MSNSAEGAKYAPVVETRVAPTTREYRVSTIREGGERLEELQRRVLQLFVAGAEHGVAVSAEPGIALAVTPALVGAAVVWAIGLEDDAGVWPEEVGPDLSWGRVEVELALQLGTGEPSIEDEAKREALEPCLGSDGAECLGAQGFAQVPHASQARNPRDDFCDLSAVELLPELGALYRSLQLVEAERGSQIDEGRETLVQRTPSTTWRSPSRIVANCRKAIPGRLRPA